jgi:prephenate dehydratase
VEAVSGVEVSLGVVPAENSTFGSVAETYDALVNADILGSAFIVGEHVLPINHALIVRRGVCVGDITAVYSHPQVSVIHYLSGHLTFTLHLQALGQCTNYLAQNLPDASKHEVPSTGVAVDLLLGPPSDQNTRIAAIASAQFTKQHSEIEILASNIQDLKGELGFAPAMLSSSS